MISVPNRLLQLNGSRFILLFIISVFVVSCGSTKQVASKRQQVVKADKGNDQNNPKNQQPSNVDTIKWSEVEDTMNPPITDDKPVVKGVPISDVKSSYNVALYMPFNSRGYADSQSSDESYIHYYAGMKLAAQNLKQNGVNLNIDVFDASNNRKIDKNDNYDIIIAPNDKSTVSELIKFGQENQILVISPWYSNSKITTDNEYYLQLRPNVKEHFTKMVEHISQNFRPEEVALVGLDQKNYKSWFKYLQEDAKAFYNQKEDPFLEHYVMEDSLALGEYVFAGQIKEGIKAFVVPNYNFKDENHVYSVLRKLNGEKGMEKIYVYGMPLMLDSDKINFDFYNNLNIKIVISDFVDHDSYDAKVFKQQYFNEYEALPNKDAYEGHDLMSFIADAVSTHGNHFPPDIKGEIKTYLQTSFDIRGVNSKDKNLEVSSKVDFYENKHLNIIEFRDGKFRKS